MDRLPSWEVLAESFLLVIIICQDVFTGLLLGQRTGLGRALSRYMLVMGLTFTGALFIPVWPEVFLSRPWYWGIRLAIILSAGIALAHVVGSFGGVRASCALIWDRWHERVMGRRTWLNRGAPAALAVGIGAVLVLLWLTSLFT